jgi:hypothetical protein
LPSDLLLDALAITVEYRMLHGVLDKASLPYLRSLRVICHDHQIVFGDAFRDDVLTRLSLPALERVDVDILSKFTVSHEQLLTPFASGVRKGTVRADIKFRSLYWFAFSF